ncbi:MAG: M23 family metallopeptidase [Ilumatobacter sp.]|uniref:M23 family metallopeptidase n=1 Tax=Ilumatobacter sp. TaxID=1967498 RepID=UPI00329739CF
MIAGFSALHDGSGRATGSELAGAASATRTAVRTRLDDLLTFPVLVGSGLITLNNFGGRSVSSGACAHRGIDIFPTDDVPRVLVSCIDGVLDGQRILEGSQGNAWVLRDGDGVSYRYHHVGEFEPGLEVGSVVRRGDVLGTMGSTGNAGNAHLHFEVRPDGTGANAIDPIPLLPFPIVGVVLGAPTGCS